MTKHSETSSNLGRVKRLAGRLVVLIGSVVVDVFAHEVQPTHEPVSVMLVYRRRNAARVLRFIQNVQAGGPTNVALWALDEIDPALAAWTVGYGEGGRFELLQRCARWLAPSKADWMVIADDDIFAAPDAVRKAVSIAWRLDLDIAQLSHSWNSHFSYSFTVRRPSLVARSTDFVEIGPTLVFPAKNLGLIKDAARHSPMGWGIDVEWGRRSIANEMRLGVVDAVSVRHLDRPGIAYRREEEELQLKNALDYVGVGNVNGLFRTRVRWWRRDWPIADQCPRAPR